MDLALVSCLPLDKRSLARRLGSYNTNQGHTFVNQRGVVKRSLCVDQTSKCVPCTKHYFGPLCSSFLCSLGGLSTYCRLSLYDLLVRLSPVILGVCRVQCTPTGLVLSCDESVPITVQSNLFWPKLPEDLSLAFFQHFESHRASFFQQLKITLSIIIIT